MTPQISVITPVYKAERFLRKTVQSLQAQTFQNFEVLLIDDGSPDRSGELCDEIAAEDGRFKVIHQSNKGMSGARNTGLKAASAPYIAFVDSDDTLHPQFFEFLYDEISEHGYDFVSSRTLVTPTQEVDCRTLVRSDLKRLELRNDDAYKLAITDKFDNIFSKLYKRELFAHTFFKEGMAYEDVEIAEPLFKQCTKALFLEFEGYFYFKNPDGVSKRRNLKFKYDRFSAFLRNRNIAKAQYPDLVETCERLAFETAASLLFWNHSLKVLSDEQVNVVRQYLTEVIASRPFNKDKLRAGLALRCPTFCDLGLRLVK